MKPKFPACLQGHMGAIKAQITEVSIEDMEQTIGSGALVIDIREPQEHAQGVVAGALAIPRGVLEFNLFNLPMLMNLSEEDALAKPIYLYCASGGRSALAAHSLQTIGFTNVHSVAGGFQAWTASNKPFIKP